MLQPKLLNPKELNCLGERKKSFGEYISEDFQRRYASAVVELSQLNRDLNEHLENIAEFTQQVSFHVPPRPPGHPCFRVKSSSDNDPM